MSYNIACIVTYNTKRRNYLVKSMVRALPRSEWTLQCMDVGLRWSVSRTQETVETGAVTVA